MAEIKSILVEIIQEMLLWFLKRKTIENSDYSEEFPSPLPETIIKVYDWDGWDWFKPGVQSPRKKETAT